VTDLHPREADLVRFAFADSSGASEALARHVGRCTACRDVVDMLRTQANTLRLVSPPVKDVTPDCLDAEAIAALADGSMDLVDAPGALNHLLDCSRCSQEVASGAQVLAAPEVRAEVDRLGSLPEHRHWRRIASSVIVVGAAAAALLFIVERPSSSEVAQPLYREESVTGVAAPHLIAPFGITATVDVFRWTSVPRADRYRITLFARDGSVIWETLTRDTTIVLPDLVRRVPHDTILWRVAAHVGWEDRWATSDLAMVIAPRAR